MSTTHFPARFAGRTVLITGGGTGMGRAAALRLGLEGANVVVAGRRPAELDAVVQEIQLAGGTALAIRADVTDADQVEAMVARTVEAFGALHMAWNNAGMLGALAPVHASELADVDAILATNLRGVYACLKYEIAAMLSAGTTGAIVNTSSWTAHGAMPGVAAYAASKAGIDAIARSVALEVGEHGIRINNVSPGVIVTPMSRDALGNAAAMKPFVQHAALRRVGQPEDVADAVLWLLSDEARFVTGQSLLVDGGFTVGGLRPWLNEAVSAAI